MERAQLELRDSRTGDFLPSRTGKLRPCLSHQPETTQTLATLDTVTKEVSPRLFGRREEPGRAACEVPGLLSMLLRGVVFVSDGRGPGEGANIPQSDIVEALEYRTRLYFSTAIFLMGPWTGSLITQIFSIVFISQKNHSCRDRR